MNCQTFCRQIFHFQADELPEEERRELQDHLDGCPDCARRLEFENGLLRGLKARLRPVPAPPGLETRLRAALAEQGASRGPGLSWFRAPWFAAASAALLLALLLVPGLGPSGGLLPWPGAAVELDQDVTLVDLDCDRAGKTHDQQRRCMHPQHLNAIKMDDGRYWMIRADRPTHRSLLFDRDARGRRMQIHGKFHPATQTVDLVQVGNLDADTL